MEADSARSACGKFLIIAVTVPYFYEGEAEAIARKLRSGEADYVHIRKPQSSAAEMAALLQAIPAELRSRLTLHDHFPLAEEYGAGGLHLNGRNPDLPPCWQRRVSRSCHSLREIKKGVDYATLSPIFPSISKPGYSGNLDPEEVRRYLADGHPVPVIALGGVTREALPALQAAGFDGAAMLADSWRRRFSPTQFSLQLITNPHSADEAITQTRDALAGGCRWVQLRWKDATADSLVAAGRCMAGICRRAGAIFLIDDHVELCRAIGADGVHLGKNDMPITDARLILGPQHIIGATANTPDDILAAAQAGADYIGYGPFRFTTTKKNLSPVLGLEGYAAARSFMRSRHISIPLVAIGGITAADIPAILRAGASGIALSGSIVGAPDPVAATQEIVNIIKSQLI